MDGFTISVIRERIAHYEREYVRETEVAVAQADRAAEARALADRARRVIADLKSLLPAGVA